MKISKKLVSIILCLCLMFSLIVNASEGGVADAELPSTLPEFKSASLTLYDNIAINYKVSADTSAYSKVYLVCNFNGQNYKLTNYTLNDGDLVFTFKGITPDKFGDIVTSTIFVEYNGQIYKATTATYSVMQYVENMLTANQDDTFKTLLVDILNYGAAAQNYTGYKTNALVNADLTDEQKAYGTQNSREYNSVHNAKYSVVSGAAASWTSASLALKDSVAIRYTVNLAKVSELEGVYAEFKVGTQTWKINAEQFVELSDAKYRITFNKLNVAQLSDTVLATIYDKNDNAISDTFSYSVESYVSRMATNSDGKLVALTDAMMKYGDAVVNYVENSKDYDKFINSGITLDFENGSYTVGGTNVSNAVWTIANEEDNSMLKLTKGGNSANQWGFMLSSDAAPLVAGKTYKIRFKAKAGAQVSLDYIITSGYSYAVGNYNRDVYYVTDPSTGAQSSPIFPSAGNKVVVGTNWQEFETYFTAESYEYSGITYTKPELYIVNRFWNIPLYFDDIVITPCEDAVNFNLYDTKFAKPSVGDAGDDIVVVPPERKGYIFDGWYTDKDLTKKFTATTILGNKTAYAKWIAAITETEIGDVASGVTDLGIRVTNANSYPVKFALDTNGKVTVSIFTASANNSSVSKSVVWKRTFTNSGDIGALINPAIIKGGDKLYIAVEPATGVTASISGFVIGQAATLRVVSGDVDGNNVFNANDLTALQGMANGNVAKTWLGDIDDDGVIATANDIAELNNMLNNIVETEKYGRTLVWSEEFNSGKLNTSVFGILSAQDENQIASDQVDTVNYYDGKLNMSVNNIDGTNYKVAHLLTTTGEFSFKRGYLEIRAKISGTPGQWAGIWLTGENESNTEHTGEIDIVETMPAGTNFKPNVHSWDSNNNRLAQYGEQAEIYYYDERSFNKTEYHIFGFEWSETQLNFYVDGVLYETMDISYFDNYSTGNFFNKTYPYSGLFDQFYALRFDNNIYTENITPDGAMPEFSIDYVRLYQKEGEQFKINGVIQ